MQVGIEKVIEIVRKSAKLYGEDPDEDELRALIVARANKKDALRDRNDLLARIVDAVFIAFEANGIEVRAE